MVPFLYIYFFSFASWPFAQANFAVSKYGDLYWNYTCMRGVNKKFSSRLIGVELIEELLKLFLGGESGLSALVWLL